MLLHMMPSCMQLFLISKSDFIVQFVCMQNSAVKEVVESCVDMGVEMSMEERPIEKEVSLPRSSEITEEGDNIEKKVSFLYLLHLLLSILISTTQFIMHVLVSLTTLPFS